MGSQTRFEPDAKLTQLAEAYALDAIDFVRKRSSIVLDWTDGSVDRVEAVLADMHLGYLEQPTRPSDEKVMEFARLFGSYVGELLRRKRGGEWGMITMDGQEFPGLKLESGSLIWPWGRVQNRLVQGPEDNVAHYYQVIMREDRPQRGMFALLRRLLGR